MAIIERGQPIHLVNPNKHICLWHQGLAHVSNRKVVRALKLIEDISFSPAKEYNVIKVLLE